MNIAGRPFLWVRLVVEGRCRFPFILGAKLVLILEVILRCISPFLGLSQKYLANLEQFIPFALFGLKQIRERSRLNH